VGCPYSCVTKTDAAQMLHASILQRRRRADRPGKVVTCYEEVRRQVAPSAVLQNVAAGS
jgi:hypothetical protein